jgi:hypothetical protein
MGVDISCEHLLTLPEAAASLPGRPNVSTVHRWRLRGVRGVRLESCRIGGRRYTSVEALCRFAAKTTAVADGETEPRTPHRRAREIARADEECRAAGI